MVKLMAVNSSDYVTPLHTVISSLMVKLMAVN